MGALGRCIKAWGIYHFDLKANEVYMAIEIQGYEEQVRHRSMMTWKKEAGTIEFAELIALPPTGTPMADLERGHDHADESNADRHAYECPLLFPHHRRGYA
jgi:hypothetical protein